MKKMQFFTLVKVDNVEKVDYVSGYTDGRFHYYRSSHTGTWFAIEPAVGLAAASAPTRKEVERRAYANAEKIGEFMRDAKRAAQAQARFDRALAAIGARPATQLPV